MWNQARLTFRFSDLKELNLSNNNLTTLVRQSLGDLPKLQVLDIRFNRLESLKDTVRALSKCAKLDTLWMQVRAFALPCNIPPGDHIPGQFGHAKHWNATIVLY